VQHYLVRSNRLDAIHKLELANESFAQMLLVGEGVPADRWLTNIRGQPYPKRRLDSSVAAILSIRSGLSTAFQKLAPVFN
jgi:hypothetical protein